MKSVEVTRVKFFKVSISEMTIIETHQDHDLLEIQAIGLPSPATSKLNSYCGV